MKRLALLVLVVPVAVITAGLVREEPQNWPRSVLITNDDGIDANGLRALVEAFAPIAKVYVVAPLENRSGSTNDISAIARREIEVVRRDLGENVIAYGVDGYPADAVAIALHGLLDEKPDLVISGINTGPNLADDWNLSGTVGAAMTAALFGTPAIAVSGYTDDEPETLAAAASWTAELARSRVVRELEPGGYLTVSIPRVPVSDITGVDAVRRGPRPWNLEYEPAGNVNDAPRQRWSLSFATREVDPPAGTDLHSYWADRIAVVPMRVDEHDYELLTALQKSGSGIPGWPPSGESR